MDAGAAGDPASFESGLRWFRQFQVDEAKARQRCSASMSSLRRSIRENWPRMRVALSLTRPRFMENRLLPDTSTRINVNAQHPFSESVSLPRLSADEQARAIRIYEKEVARLRALFRKKTAEKRPESAPSVPADAYLSGEERFVVQELPLFRAEQERVYLGLVAAYPILALVDSAEPSAQTLSRALTTV